MADSRAETVFGHLHHLLCPTAASAEDGRLLERFVDQRDEAAFAELVGRHGPFVMGLCHRLLGNVQDAEDVFQATFFVLARKAATIRKPESLSCWLHGVASRLALKVRAQAQRRRCHERQAASLLESADVDLSWSEVRGLIDEELQRLPQKQRFPLILCYLEGLTQDEASRRLGWPRGTLKRRLEAGRERLRIRLTRRGVTLGAGLFAVALAESASRAAVPVALRSATVRASIEFLIPKSATIAATPAALLAQGALQTVMTTKLKLGAMLILVLSCAATALGLAMPHAPLEKQLKNKAEARTAARPADNTHTRKDLYGDPLPKGAMARLGTLRLRHQSTTSSAVFSRDGKTAIVGDHAGNIIFWDVATAKEVRRLQIPGSVYALAITRDGKTLASASWGQLFFWDVGSGKLLSQAQVDNDAINQMLFTPDGKTLALRDQGKTIHLWDAVGHKKLHDLMGHKGNVTCMALRPDGKTLASGSRQDQHIILWDVATGKEKRRIATGDRDVLSLDFSPDGKKLASICNLASFTFFDAETGEMLRKVTHYHGGVSPISYAPDGKSLVGIGGGKVYLLDGDSGKLLRTFDAPRRLMAGLTISPDGKTVATFWGGAHTFDLWDVASGKLLHPAPGHRTHLTALAFSADGRQVFSAAGIGDFPVQVWDARTGERPYELGVNPNSVEGIVLSPDGKLLAACGYNDHTIRLWDIASRKEVRVFKGHKAPIDSISWSADGKAIASASMDDKSLRIWDAATGKQRWQKAIDADWAAVVALAPDGKTVAVGGFANGAIRLWSAETSKELGTIKTPQQLVYTLVFSPDGSTLASGGMSGTIHFWEPATGRLLKQWDTKTGWTSELAYALDGRALVSGHNDGSVRLWEVATGKERACFVGHRGGVRAVAISRDGRSVASGSEDTTALVWDATGGVRPDAELTAKQLQSLWGDLIDTDAVRAHRAIWQLALAPKYALPFLAKRLPPVAPLDAEQQKRADHLLADLDSERFAVRQTAQTELEKMGSIAESALRKALENKPSLEVRRRIEAVLAQPTNERSVRLLRTLETIEHMNTPEAVHFLDKLADGAPRAWLTEEARAVRKRMTEQSAATPQR